MKSRALADHGAQDLLACRQMLPVIKEQNIWIKEQTCAKNFKLDGHLHRSGDQKLCAECIMVLKVTIERTVVVKSVSCSILESSKAFWLSTVKDCGVIIGTNALEQLGLILWTVKVMS